jgi:hypothetical protein
VLGAERLLGDRRMAVKQRLRLSEDRRRGAKASDISVRRFGPTIFTVGRLTFQQFNSAVLTDPTIPAESFGVLVIQPDTGFLVIGEQDSIAILGQIECNLGRIRLRIESPALGCKVVHGHEDLGDLFEFLEFKLRCHPQALWM